MRDAVRRTTERIEFQKDQGIEITVEEKLSIQPKSLDKEIRSLLKESSDALEISNCTNTKWSGS